MPFQVDFLLSWTQNEINYHAVPQYDVRVFHSRNPRNHARNIFEAGNKDILNNRHPYVPFF